MACAATFCPAAVQPGFEVRRQWAVMAHDPRVNQPGGFPETQEHSQSTRFRPRDACVRVAGSSRARAAKLDPRAVSDSNHELSKEMYLAFRTWPMADRCTLTDRRSRNPLSPAICHVPSANLFSCRGGRGKRSEPSPNPVGRAQEVAISAAYDLSSAMFLPIMENRERGFAVPGGASRFSREPGPDQCRLTPKDRE